jgi:hypothetical protein
LDSLIADLLVIIHLFFIVFVIFGAILCFFNGKWAWLHIPAVLWGAGIELTGRLCPLTPLENRLRLAAGGPEYDVGYISHYFLPMIYPTGLTRNIQIVLGLSALLFNLLLYTAMLIRKQNHRLHQDN